MPCPKGIDIPKLFSLMNYERVYGLTSYAKSEYGKIVDGMGKEDIDATACVSCGACEKKCPQHIKIIDQLKETHMVLTKA